MNAVEFARKAGFEACVELDTRLLVPQESIRAFCEQNKCGFYQANYMCPPLVGTVDEFKDRFAQYKSGVLLQYSQRILHQESMSLKEKFAVYGKTRRKFHRQLLKVESYFREKGALEVWGMIGGSCALCKVCGAVTGKPCRHPEQARLSVEASGINVLELLQKLGLDNKFYRDKIIWTGCILCKDDTISRAMQ
jgi:predicted metal-binding protein